ncbi:TonB-dependent receptor domain-containing protein [Janthinobacterium fluminis]|uniref:TonB-dependent receptor n=1 Tax=Janthinobacterium fluminis TaxID=2987524 RepID=A0ABT5JY57_9BURK|nr:TonB-dependent receptor [Janthinobacterium fluminis]MDC8757579.1 TonB-dependent receptor [Janthinobacterium fluminis]
MKNRNTARRSLRLIPCVLSIAVGSAWANPEPVRDAAPLPVVVVTASGAALDIHDAPASISVISREEIERQPVYDLATLLRRIPGVSGGNSPTGDQSKIKLRGLPDKYTLILVDGKRQGNSADTNYRPDLGRQDLNWISPEMIERIEVVRGPMSSLYGSDAMGGVINIITRKVPKKWAGSATANYTRPQDSDRGTAHQLGLNLAGPLADGVGVRLGVSQTRQNPDDTSGGLHGGVGGERNDTVTGQLNWALAPNQNLSLDASYGKQRATASSQLNAKNRPVQPAWGASELVRTSVGIGHEGRWSFGKTKINLYHNDYDNKIAEATAKSSDTAFDATLEKRLNFGFEQLLTLGGQWKREKLTNTDTIGTVPSDYNGKEVSGASLSGSTSALFAEDQIYLREDLTATLGARLDHHGKFGNNTSPRVYLVYHPLPEWTVRGGVSKGFRAPSLKENSPSAATQSGGNGCGSLRPLGYVNEGCYMAGNADLKPETSESGEIGVAYARAGWDLGLTYFRTNFKNKIDYAPLGKAHGYWWTKMQNIQKARTSGVEATATIPLSKDISLRNNLTYMAEAKNLSTGANLLATPKVSVFSALGWQVNDQLYAEVTHQYTGKQLDGGNVQTKAYRIVDALASYKLGQQFTLRAGIENLFKKGPKADGAVNYYVPGRRVFVGATSNF